MLHNVIYTLLPSPQSPRSTLSSMLISIDARPTHLVLGLQVRVKTIVSFTFVPLFFLLFFSCRKCICNDAPTSMNSITFFKLSTVLSQIYYFYTTVRDLNKSSFLSTFLNLLLLIDAVATTAK